MECYIEVIDAFVCDFGLDYVVHSVKGIILPLTVSLVCS